MGTRYSAIYKKTNERSRYAAEIQSKKKLIAGSTGICDFWIANGPDERELMPTTPLDRLMFAQGGLCFFCKQPLPKGEASVEHLVASSNGGSNNDENRVACCKAVNALLGSMSLKEKIQVVLNQQGQFRCPNGIGSTKPAAQSNGTTKTSEIAEAKKARFELVVTNLKQRGNSKPRTLKTLTSTIASLLPKDLPRAELAALVQQLRSTGMIAVTGTKVTYQL